MAAKKGERFCCSEKCLILACCGFILLMIGSAAFVIAFPKMFQMILEQKMSIVEGTPAYKEWSASSLPLYTKIYLFSITNPNQTLAKLEKPNLKQMGPYTFREVEEKDGVIFNDNGTVTYKVKKRWFYEPDMSVGSLDDIVTTVNLPAIAAANEAKNDYFMAWGISSTLSTIEAGVFIDRSVRELLFEGYKDTLLAIAEMVGKESEVPLDRFGWFYKRNGTTWGDGVFNMFTGEDDVSKLGQINTWKNQHRTNFDDECGKVQGSAQGFYPPGMTQPNILLFSHEACRALSFNYKGQTDIRSVPSLVYKLDETTFANGTVHPPNECFHNNLPTGVQNNTHCKVNSPSFLSFPHFYHADPYYVDQFQAGSMNPNGAEHESRIVMEPTTSIPLEVAIRLQINIKIDPIDNIELFNNVPELYYPALWFEGLAQTDEAGAGMVAFLISMPDKANVAGVVLVLAGLLGVIVTVTLRCTRYRPRTDPAHNSVEDAENDKLSTIFNPIIRSGKDVAGKYLPVNVSLMPSAGHERKVSSSESEMAPLSSSSSTSTSSSESEKASLSSSSGASKDDCGTADIHSNTSLL